MLEYLDEKKNEKRNKPFETKNKKKTKKDSNGHLFILKFPHDRETFSS